MFSILAIRQLKIHSHVWPLCHQSARNPISACCNDVGLKSRRGPSKSPLHINCHDTRCARTYSLVCALRTCAIAKCARTEDEHLGASRRLKPKHPQNLAAHLSLPSFSPPFNSLPLCAIRGTKSRALLANERCSMTQTGALSPGSCRAEQMKTTMK